MKKIILIIALALAGIVMKAQNIYTVAGNNAYYYNGDSIPAISSSISPGGSIAVDKYGNLYINDIINNRIRKVDISTGLMTTIAGTGTSGYNGDGIPATSAQIYYPRGIAVDTNGNVYFGDYSNNRLRRIDAVTGLISTVAGTGTYGYNGDGILAVNADITEVMGVAIDGTGNIFFSDLGNRRVRKIDKATGMISTVAGNGELGYTGDDCLADTTRLNNPNGVAVDKYGNVYIADKENNRIRKVDAITGIITTVAGRGEYNIYNGDGIPADSAYFRYSSGVAVDDSLNIYISDEWNGMVYKVYNTTGLIYTVAGTLSGGVTTEGVQATTAMLSYPNGVTLDSCNNIYITSSGRYRIQKVLSYGVSTVTTNISCNALCNGSIDLTVTGGSSPYSYDWNGGLPQQQDQTVLCAGLYYVIITDNDGCMENLYFTLTEPEATEMTVNTTNATCNNDGSASLSISVGYWPFTYLWSNGDTLSFADSLAAGDYTVTATDGLGCMTTDSFSILNDTASYQSIPICMVTVDSSSKYNIIVWDKTSVTNVDTFIVCREISTNNYQPIARIPYDSLSQFIDTARTLYFPNTGDPNTGTYRYKIQCHDTCGRTSEMSPFHNTIYFMYSSGMFTWPQLYTIENGANPVGSYVLMRDDSSNGNWHAIGSVAGTQQFITDPQYSQYANTATWRVKTQWSISCIPTYKLFTGYAASFSNVFTNVHAGINENSFDDLVNIFPNPANDKIEISLSCKSEIEILNMEGQILRNIKMNGDHTSIDVSEFPKGMYFVKVKNEKGVSVKKFIKE